MGHRFTWFEEQRGHRSATCHHYMQISTSLGGKKAYEVVGIAAENSQPIENERERSVPRRCCSTSRCLPSFFLPFFLSFFLVAGEYYYSRQNSSSDSSLVAGECEGRGAYIGRVKLEQRRNQIAGYRGRSRCIGSIRFASCLVLTGSSACVIVGRKFCARSFRLVAFLEKRDFTYSKSYYWDRMERKKGKKG